MVKYHTADNHDFSCDHDLLRYIPVVDSAATMNLLYEVKVEDLKQYCEIYYNKLYK